MTGSPVREAVVLAAGDGTRLAGVTTLPKPLLPVAGRTVDTGMFLFSDRMFPVMRECAQARVASLSAGMASLAREGTMHTWDIGDGYWINIDTPTAWAEAQRLASDGLVGTPCR